MLATLHQVIWSNYIQMFHNDLSYLYSDECLTPRTSNEKELSGNVSKFSPDRSTSTRLYQRMGSTFSFRHRSKHILLIRGDVLQPDRRREKNRIKARLLREKQQLLERNLLKKIQQLENEQLYLENDLKQREAYKRDLQTEINNNFSLNTLAELLLMKKDKIPHSFDQCSNDFELSNISTTNVLNLNNDINHKFDS